MTERDVTCVNQISSSTCNTDHPHSAVATPLAMCRTLLLHTCYSAVHNHSGSRCRSVQGRSIQGRSGPKFEGLDPPSFVDDNLEGAWLPPFIYQYGTMIWRRRNIDGHTTSQKFGG